MKAVTVRAHGRVQGVCYRASARREAARLGLAGWVRNMSDGTVTMLLQGDAGAIEAMLAWCRVGPPGAEVAWLDCEDVETDDTLSGFDVR